MPKQMEECVAESSSPKIGQGWLEAEAERRGLSLEECASFLEQWATPPPAAPRPFPFKRPKWATARRDTVLEVTVFTVSEDGLNAVKEAVSEYNKRARSRGKQAKTDVGDIRAELKQARDRYKALNKSVKNVERKAERGKCPPPPPNVLAERRDAEAVCRRLEERLERATKRANQSSTPATVDQVPVWVEVPYRGLTGDKAPRVMLDYRTVQELNKLLKYRYVTLSVVGSRSSRTNGDPFLRDDDPEGMSNKLVIRHEERGWKRDGCKSKGEYVLDSISAQCHRFSAVAPTCVLPEHVEEAAGW